MDVRGESLLRGEGSQSLDRAIHKLLAVLASAAAVSLLQAPVQGGYWTNSSGSALSGHFAWDGGCDGHGAFGDPVVTAGDRFVFTQAAVNASASDGGTSSVSDELSFNIHLTPGFWLSEVRVRAFGDYLLQGEASHADLSAGLRLEEFEAQDPLTSPRLFQSALTTSVAFPLFPGGAESQGTWSGETTLVLCNDLPMPDDDLHISFTIHLSTWAAAAGTANLGMDSQDAAFEIAFLPEPTSLVLLGLGGLGLLCSRSRRVAWSSLEHR